MREIVSTVTSKGQITIPVEVRRHLRLATGDRVAFLIDEGGAVRVQLLAYPTVASLVGAAGTLDRAVPWETVEDIVREERAEAALRRRG